MYCDPVQSSVAAPASCPRSAQLEWAWGITDWLKLGAYAAVYSWTGDGRFLIDGGKLRAEFVVPHAAERSFFWGRLRARCNVRYWGTDPPSGEFRPIIGGRLGPVDLILGTSFQGRGALDFTPASRVAYHFSEIRAAALEHYADYGRLNRHYKSAPLHVELGIGHGFTAASDRLVLKLIL